MRMILKIIGCMALILIFSAGLLSFWWIGQKQKMYEDSYQSSYSYSISILTNQTLSNVIFYLPIPVLNNTSAVGKNIVENQFNEINSSWEYALVETEHGLMLSMKKDMLKPVFYSEATERIIPDTDPQEVEIIRITSDQYSEETPYPDTLDFSTLVVCNRSISTKNPLGHEMVLMPKYNLIQNFTANESHLWMAEQPEVYTYQSKIYAQYETSPDAQVIIDIRMDAFNEWWVGGWQSNSFTDFINIRLSGPQHSWVSAHGEIITGIGVYMDA